MAKGSNGNGDELAALEQILTVPLAPSDGNEEFPVPFARFAATLHHTHDEVWLTHLRVKHGRENHKISEWVTILDRYRRQPAHPDHPGFRASEHG
jgi:hypothetical protein